MGKKKSAQQSRNRQKNGSPLDEIKKGIEALRERVAQVEDLRREGFPYRDAARARADLQVRETIRKIFGERSSEFQRLKHHKLTSTNEADIAHTLVILNDLIRGLEERHLDAMGVPLLPPSANHEPPLNQTGQVLSSGNPPATSGDTPPIGFSQPDATVPWTSPTAHPSTPLSPHKTQTTAPGRRHAPVQAPATHQLSPAGRDVSLSPPPHEQHPSALRTFREGEEDPDLGNSLARLMTLGHRFHFVARQLRLRREYRATLEVEDQHDVQDLFLSLLRLDFADISTDEWIPSYAEFSSHTAVLLHKGQLGIILKKTRPGWGPREVAAELAVDTQHYANRYPGCKALFCFVYDPEGRIGDPRIIESEQSGTVHGLSLRLLISPK